jgi:hypothetical protein
MEALFASLMGGNASGANAAFDPFEPFYQQFESRAFNTFDVLEGWFPQHLQFIRTQKNMFAAAIGGGAIKQVVQEFYIACKPYQRDIAMKNEAVVKHIITLPLFSDLDKELHFETELQHMEPKCKEFIWSSLAAMLVLAKKIMERRVEMPAVFQHPQIAQVFQSVCEVADQFQKERGREPQMNMEDISFMTNAVKQRITIQPAVEIVEEEEKRAD